MKGGVDRKATGQPGVSARTISLEAPVVPTLRSMGPRLHSGSTGLIHFTTRSAIVWVWHSQPASCSLTGLVGGGRHHLIVDVFGWLMGN